MIVNERFTAETKIDDSEYYRNKKNYKKTAIFLGTLNIFNLI